MIKHKITDFAVFCFILAICNSSNAVTQQQILLTNEVLKIVDGVKGLMDATKVHKILYMGQIINKFVNGNIDSKSKKRVPQHRFGAKLYTLNELVKIEEEFEAKYGPIYKTENPRYSHRNNLDEQHDQPNKDSKFDENVLPASPPQGNELQDTNLNELEDQKDQQIQNNKLNELEEESKNYTDNLTKLEQVTKNHIQNLTKEERSQYEESKKCFHETLHELKEKFLKETGPFLKDARGTKKQMYRLIQEWTEKADRLDSLLLGWNSEEEGASFRRNVTSIKKLHSFCCDLTDFLKVLVHSCPKALKAFISANKDNPSYKLLSRAKPDDS